MKGAYAALISDVYLRKWARKSNDANIACFGAFTVGILLMEKLADTFLASEFEPGCASQPKVDATHSCEKRARLAICAEWTKAFALCKSHVWSR